MRLDDVAPRDRAGVFTPAGIEELAFLKHRCWHNERLQRGWVAGPPRDDKRRIHPDLVPYDGPSEQGREYDCAAARTIIRALEQAVFAVVQ